MESSNNTPSLFDVVKQFEKIKVDDYQRTYAWSRDEINDLFDDLKDCVDNKDFHFFGTLIFQAKDNQLGTIVDGQQRLTTIFVFVATLRDEILKLGPDMEVLPRNEVRKLPIPVINKAWDFIYHDLDPNKPRFESNRFLAELLLRSVYAEPGSQAEIRERDNALTLAFRKAVKEIRKLVAEDLASLEAKEDRLVRINDFLDAIRDRFLVLRVQTHSLSESLEIFLTLNNRGLPLGPSDLVRGEVIAALSSGESEENQLALHRRVFDEWSDIADNVKEVEVFLRHFLVSTGTEKVQKKKVFDKVASRLKGETAQIRKANAKSFWSDLQRASEVYSQIIAPKYSGDLNYHLEILHGLMKSHRILLLSVLQAPIDLGDIERIVRQVYVLAFRWVMSGGNAQKLEDTFQRLGNEFRESFNVQRLVSDLTTISEELNDEVILNYLRNEADEGFTGKAVLHGINRALNPQANAVTLDSNLHLEHIAPQTATREWQIALFAGDERQFSEYDSVVSQLGNLTLLDFKINSSIRQADISIKRSKYGQSVMQISRDLSQATSWSWHDIERRTSYLLDCFSIVFASKPPSLHPGNFFAN